MGLFNRSGGNSGDHFETGDSVISLANRTKNARGKVDSVRDTEMGWRVTVTWIDSPKAGQQEELAPSELRGTNNF